MTRLSYAQRTARKARNEAYAATLVIIAGIVITIAILWTGATLSIEHTCGMNDHSSAFALCRHVVLFGKQ